jgi:hypothetical protein
MSNVEGSPNERMTNKQTVVPSEVENGVAWEAATWTGRPKAERTGSERIKSRDEIEEQFRGILRLRFASLRMTIGYSDFVIFSSFVICRSSFPS